MLLLVKSKTQDTGMNFSMALNFIRTLAQASGPCETSNALMKIQKMHFLNTAS